MRTWTLALVCGLRLLAAEPADLWMERVRPLLTAAERDLYTGLADGAPRDNFREEFWRKRSISRDEYFRRLAVVDATFGSGKLLSGTRTSQGRVYLALGQPSSTMRLASSRVFFPIEIWFYDGLQEPGIPANIHLIFFRRGGTGDFTLYSPQLDTIRALLNPQTSTRGMFPVNDIVTAEDIRQRLELPPAEMAVAESAIHVAMGVTGSANNTILARVSSPAAVINHPPVERVSSRILSYDTRAKVRSFESAGPESARTVDLEIVLPVRKSLLIEVRKGDLPVAAARADLGFAEPERIHYLHRVHLLPGDYVLVIDADGHAMPQPLHVGGGNQPGEILVGAAQSEARHTPFLFGALVLKPSSRPDTVLVETSKPEPVRWVLRRGSATVWSATSRSDDRLATAPLPRGLAPGAYSLSAEGAGWSRTAAFSMAAGDEEYNLVSYNANLAPVQVWNAVGRQHMARNDLAAAGRCFEQARQSGGSEETQINLARLEAMRGNFDGSRNLVSPVLEASPRNLEALALMGYLKAQLQDYEVAAGFYRRALEVRRTPELERALAAVNSHLPAAQAPQAR